jgi:hypothetical protein
MFVYIIRHRISRKAYVGITVLSVEERFRDHLYAAFGKRSPGLLYASMRKSQNTNVGGGRR